MCYTLGFPNSLSSGRRWVRRFLILSATIYKQILSRKDYWFDLRKSLVGVSILILTDTPDLPPPISSLRPTMVPFDLRSRWPCNRRRWDLRKLTVFRGKDPFVLLWVKLSSSPFPVSCLLRRRNKSLFPSIDRGASDFFVFSSKI